MTLAQTSSRDAFAHTLAADASTGRKSLLLAPLGAGKTHTLVKIAASLQETSIPFVFLDLFTAASTPERLLAALVGAVHPFMVEDADSVEALAKESASDRRNSSRALLHLLDLLTMKVPSRPFVWLIDEVTEIRSLAYFPDLGAIEAPFARALRASRGAVLTSSYLGLAGDLFADLERVLLPGLTSSDLEEVPSLRSDSHAIATAITVTHGSAATLLPLVADLRDSRDVTRSLIHLLMPGGALELTCRRRYEVLLMRSRGYAVSKRAAEVVAAHREKRLTDLFPLIGRTPGASRQYLRWLVEVGLLTQIKKRYDFADPILGLWAGLYLGRAGHPTEGEIRNAVVECVNRVGDAPPITLEMARPRHAADGSGLRATEGPKKRVDRFEEID
ncbi:MAG: hypothetical protein JJE39_15815 [Vicinamibacteria bacterium]|nr:hypothetical protein [Vicinamibacteria bacterium]